MKDITVKAEFMLIYTDRIIGPLAIKLQEKKREKEKERKKEKDISIKLIGLLFVSDNEKGSFNIVNYLQVIS